MTRANKDKPPKRARPRSGLLHIVDAAGYSLAGLRRLWGETAARLEIGGAAVVAVLFALRGAEPWHWLVALFLFALVLAMEAINTALEDLADHLSPEWSQMAKNVKDLGSLAVGLMLLATSGFVAAVLLAWL
ncbi:MAG: diacylglycerol kinase (ATP dependent) [Roseibaca calidilacus]|uniref:Diacylglycerol kinase n=1 Tax=Roseibaca calidilacus TaxID=1666912 RepID=A0A0N8K753_9RHOB|nr:diacylglycerol kinase [Roseibaca calidilacus]KPP90777.1 MAG: diacylglycerol kinase (ATP dependent) [Roseibaca calidilacus]CUX83545.1 diacylglycerol kinase (ATP) [Roseibaca calidilacus]